MSRASANSPAGPQPDQEHLLLFRPDHLGDLLHTTPVLHALRVRFPQTYISILVGSWAAGLLKGNPDPDEIIVCDLPWLNRGPNPSWKPMLSGLRQLRARRIDRVLNFRVAAKSAGVSRLCGARERWGFDVLKSRWAWTHTVPYSRDRHVVDCYMDLAGALGASTRPVRFRVFPETEPDAPVRDLLQNIAPPVVLGVTAGYPAKSWLPERWAAVADHVAERGFSVLLNGGPSEGHLVAEVQSRMQHNAISLVGKFSLLQLASLLKACVCLVTLDSFPMHLAVAVNTPVVALFGATASRQWGPYPNGQPNVVVAPPAEIPRNAAAMRSIQVHQVVEALNRLLETVAPSGSGNSV